MILSDDTLLVKQEYGVYRTAPRQKLGLIAKDEQGEFRFYPSGVTLTGKDVKYIDMHVTLANSFEGK